MAHGRRKAANPEKYKETVLRPGLESRAMPVCAAHDHSGQPVRMVGFLSQATVSPP